MGTERRWSGGPRAPRRRRTGGAAAGGESGGRRGRGARERVNSGAPGLAGRSDETRKTDATERAKQVMRRLLSVRMRSRRELELRLAQRRFRRDVIDGALDDFQRVGLVNDREFARLFLESRLRTRPRSYSVLVHELRAKGVADEIIKDAVSEFRNEVTEEDLARRALKVRLRSMRSGSPDEIKARAARFLAGRGFAPSLIVEVVKDI